MRYNLSAEVKINKTLQGTIKELGNSAGITSPEIDKIRVMNKIDYENLPLEEKSNKRILYFIMG